MLALLTTCILASAADYDTAWANSPVTLTNADLLEIYSGITTAQMNAMADRPKGLVSLAVRLMDSEGRTRFDIVFEEELVAELQRSAPGKQTAALLEAHSVFSGRLAVAGEDRIGLFHDHQVVGTGVAQAMTTFIRTRRPEDIVLTIGFKQGEEVFRYATVTEGRVDFDPKAPAARE